MPCVPLLLLASSANLLRMDTASPSWSGIRLGVMLPGRRSRLWKAPRCAAFARSAFTSALASKSSPKPFARRSRCCSVVFSRRSLQINGSDASPRSLFIRLRRCTERFVARPAQMSRALSPRREQAHRSRLRSPVCAPSTCASSLAESTVIALYCSLSVLSRSAFPRASEMPRSALVSSWLWPRLSDVRAELRHSSAVTPAANSAPQSQQRDSRLSEVSLRSCRSECLTPSTPTRPSSFASPSGQLLQMCPASTASWMAILNSWSLL
mmetsp:Transcript_23547/g.53576  ORF Transcript_23547/g.53576 Transcript_23547/m.53576 type:complete len:267 (+) Transcript_23547:397-1197(+)